MMKTNWNAFYRKCFAALLAAALIASTGCSVNSPSEETIPGPTAVIKGKEFCVRDKSGEYEPVFLNGVNMGVTKPGSFPGEFAIPKEDYLRWFRQISEMNVQVIRVYVSQMPAFYEALKDFNAKADHPLYLIQGVYMNEEMISEYNNAFGGSGALQDSFCADIRNAVDIIHGSVEIERLPGNAGGEYTADVSDWVIGWILGVEWSADFVIGTNSAHADKTSFEGGYVRTENASPFEVFLAGAAETAISYEMEHYGKQRPVALSNWCTTCLLYTSRCV